MSLINQISSRPGYYVLGMHLVWYYRFRASRQFRHDMLNVVNELAYGFGLALPYLAGSVRPSSSRAIYSLLLVGAAAQVEDDGTRNEIPTSGIVDTRYMWS
jgi:hypothetical protein